MKRTFTVIGQLLLLLTFIACSSLSVLDLFGYLDRWKEYLSLDYTKVTLLAVGLIGSVLVLQRWLSLSATERTVQTISRQTDALPAILERLRHMPIPPSVLPNRTAIYTTFTNALNERRGGEDVLVTHFEKLRSHSFVDGETEHEQAFMQTWTRVLQQRDVVVRQIVHVSSQRDVQEVLERVAMFDGLPNYLLNVIVGPPVIPVIEFAVLGTRWASVCFPSDVVSAQFEGVGLQSQDSDVVGLIRQVFEIYWTKLSIPVHDRNGPRLPTLEWLRSVVPKSDFPDDAWRIVPLVLHLGTTATLRECSAQMLDLLGHIDRTGVEDVLMRAVETPFRSFLKEVDEVYRRKFDVEAKEISLLLLEATRGAEKEFCATSYDDRQVEFWLSDYGQQLLMANAEATKRGVAATRLFIVDAGCMDSRPFQKVLREHCNAGVKVFMMPVAEVPAQMRRDLVVIDSRLLIEIQISTDPRPQKPGWVVVDDRVLHRTLEDIQGLLVHAKAVIL